MSFFATLFFYDLSKYYKLRVISTFSGKETFGMTIANNYIINNLYTGGQYEN